MSMHRSKTGSRPAWAYLLLPLIVVDLVLAISTGLISNTRTSFLVNQLNLAVEQNSAVWWSSATLLLTAMLLVDSAFRHSAQRTVLLILASLMTILSLDELGSLHERMFTGSFWGYLPYGLVGGLLFLYAFIHLYRSSETRPISILFFAGFSCFGSVIIQEFFEHNLNWPIWLLGARVMVEEGVELMGTAFCLIAAMRLMGYDKAAQLMIPERSASSILYWRVTLVIASACAVYTAFVSPNLSGYPGLGNPSMWFAMAAYLILAYEMLRGRQSWLHLRPVLLSIGLAMLLSLVHVVFSYKQNDLAKLVMVDLAGFLILSSLATRFCSFNLRNLIIGAVPVLILGWLALTGSDESAFLLAFTVPLILIGQFVEIAQPARKLTARV